MTKKVSVIIPVYNVEAYIGCCLDSVLRQTYTNIEIVCVDDCGTDDSVRLVQEYCARYPGKLRLIPGTENVGLGGARDKGLAAASGEYVAFIDSDDYIKPDFIERYMRAALRFEADVVVGGYICDQGGRYRAYPMGREPGAVWMNVSACTKLYRRSFLIENQLDFRGVRRYEDEGFLYRWLQKKPRVTAIPYEGYYYRLNDASITRSRQADRTALFCEYMETVEGLLPLLAEMEQPRLFQYCLASGLTANLLYNGRGCGWPRMRALYERYDALLGAIDPELLHNPWARLRRLRSEPAKKRYATWLVIRFRRLGWDRLLFWLDSWL